MGLHLGPHLPHRSCRGVGGSLTPVAQRGQGTGGRSYSEQGRAGFYPHPRRNPSPGLTEVCDQ